MEQTSYGLQRLVELPYADAVAEIRRTLAEEGFGVLTEIDVRETLKRKLDVDFPPYVILGACNPTMAHRALTAEPEIGLLLPCNVVVRSVERSRSMISVFDPVAGMAMAANRAALDPIAAEVRERLSRALAAVGRPVL